MLKLKLTTFIIILNCLLIVAQFALTTTRATDGDRLDKLTSLLTSIQADNHNLQLSIYTQSSLTAISKAADVANLFPAKTVAWTQPSVALVP